MIVIFPALTASQVLPCFYLLSGRFKITKAPITPGIQPHKVNNNTIVTDPHPRSITARGGKTIANNTCKNVILSAIFYIQHTLLKIYHISIEYIPHLRFYLAQRIRLHKLRISQSVTE